MNFVLKGALVAAVISMLSVTSDAQIVVRVRPPRPKVIVVRSAPPSRYHVWVDEDWVVAGRGYRWNGGHWAAPPRMHAVWMPGYWRNSRRGDIWVPGYWR
jgi:hypothetical protein